MVAKADAGMLIEIPPAGTPERAEVARALAARLWAPRHDEPFSEVGEYWEKTFLTLAEDALAGLERQYATTDAP